MSGLSIGDAAAATGVPAWRLRAWEAEGLLHPARAANGYRRFDGDDLEVIRQLAMAVPGSRPVHPVAETRPRAGTPGVSTAYLLEQAWRSFAQVARSEEELRVVLTAGIDAVLTACAATIGAIALADHPSHRFVSLASRGLSTEYLDSIHNWQLHEGLAGRAFGQRQSLTVYDLGTHRGAARAYAWREMLRGYLCVPILLGTKRLGIIEVYAREPREFTAAEIDAVEQLSVLVAVAMEACQSREQFEALRAQRSRFSRQWTKQWSLATQAERERIALQLEELADAPAEEPLDLDGARAEVRRIAARVRAAERAGVDSRHLLRDQLGGARAVEFTAWPDALPVEFATKHALAIGQVGHALDQDAANYVVRASRRDDDLLIEFVLDEWTRDRLADLDPDTMSMLEDLGARIGTRERDAGEVLLITVELPSTAPLLRELSAREQQVLHELVSGRSNSELAAALGISVKTLQNHLTSIYRKLGVANRVAAVALLDAR